MTIGILAFLGPWGPFINYVDKQEGVIQMSTILLTKVVNLSTKVAGKSKFNVVYECPLPLSTCFRFALGIISITKWQFFWETKYIKDCIKNNQNA